ncbi:TlpA family protein disulfide reductase [Novosphingobium sp.]|uniref:TlpA family protein disulfide reductase n=1 Tax=Novosphingobium sp. TaxID=1874826 RepID=UPI003D136970
MPLISLRLPLAIALAGLSLCACDREQRAPAQPESAAASDAGSASGETFAGKIDRSHKGAALPQATVHDASGAKLDIQSLRGKPVLINLWATWCAPCVKELPTLDALAARQAGHLAVVTIAQDMAQPEKVKAELHYAHLPAWLDPDNTLGFYYNSGELPTSVLYDAQGREVWRMVGAHDWAGKDSDALIAPALK